MVVQASVQACRGVGIFLIPYPLMIHPLLDLRWSQKIWQSANASLLLSWQKHWLYSHSLFWLSVHLHGCFLLYFLLIPEIIGLLFIQSHVLRLSMSSSCSIHQFHYQDPYLDVAPVVDKFTVGDALTASLVLLACAGGGAAREGQVLYLVSCSAGYLPTAKLIRFGSGVWISFCWPSFYSCYWFWVGCFYNFPLLVLSIWTRPSSCVAMQFSNLHCNKWCCFWSCLGSNRENFCWACFVDIFHGHEFFLYTKVTALKDTRR